MAGATCPSCQHVNAPDARFCARCGGPLGAHANETTGSFSVDDLRAVLDAETAAAGVAALPAPTLEVDRGPKAGSRYALDAPTVTVGRHPDSDIFLDDVTVSRRHATFERDAGVVRVRDAGSLNGTYVNRRRVDSCELRDGDVVQIGMFKLVYRAPTPGI